MCDCLVALGRHTASGATLFAKNSDRPSAEVQRVLVEPARHDRGPPRCTSIDFDPHPAPAGEIHAWLNGKRHARQQWLADCLARRRRFVDRHAHAMPQPMLKVLTIARRFDHGAPGIVHHLAG